MAENKPTVKGSLGQLAQRLKEDDPNVFVLELGGGQYEYQPMGAMNNAFRINVQGRCWDHVSEDKLGRWVYRAM